MVPEDGWLYTALTKVVNILHISERVSTGGAARSAYRLHRGLQRIGHRSHLYVKRREIPDPTASRIRNAVANHYTRRDRLRERIGQQLERRLGILYTQHQTTKHIPATETFRQADVVHLHNLHGKYFNLDMLPAFAAAKPLVWTLHDMWALTGHCAYSYGCGRWKTGCYDCPLFCETDRHKVEPPPTRHDNTRQVWWAKRRIYHESRLHIVTPSRWLHDLARQSILNESATITCIPYGLDLDIFKPVDQEVARRSLDVPIDARVILFVSESVNKWRKCHEYLLQSLEQLDHG